MFSQYIQKNISLAHLFLGVLVLFVPQTTHAFFSNDANAEASQFEIGDLEFEVSEETLSADIEKTGTTTATFEIFEEGSIGSQYAITTEKGDSCSDEFYNSVNVSLDHEGPVFDGPLSQMSATSTAEGVWNMAFTASSTVSIPANETCEVKIRVRAWQHNFEQYQLGGFTQEKQILLTLTASEDLGPALAPAPAPLMAPLMKTLDAPTNPDDESETNNTGDIDDTDNTDDTGDKDENDKKEENKNDDKKSEEDNTNEGGVEGVMPEDEKIEDEEKKINVNKEEEEENENAEDEKEEENEKEEKEESVDEGNDNEKSEDEKPKTETDTPAPVDTGDSSDNSTN